MIHSFDALDDRASPPPQRIDNLVYLVHSGPTASASRRNSRASATVSILSSTRIRDAVPAIGSTGGPTTGPGPVGNVRLDWRWLGQR